MVRVPLCLALLGVAGCFAPASPSQRLAESAHDMNTATRFGRMDVALEHVGSAAKDDFTKKHGAWGKSLRIVDLELGGMKLKNKGTEAEVFVTVTWQRLDDADVRVTNVTQRWTDVRGTWSLIGEEEKGDPGLLADAAKASAGAAHDTPPRIPPRRTQVIREEPE